MTRKREKPSDPQEHATYNIREDARRPELSTMSAVPKHPTTFMHIGPPTSAIRVTTLTPGAPDHKSVLEAPTTTVARAGGPLLQRTGPPGTGTPHHVITDSVGVREATTRKRVSSHSTEYASLLY